MPDSQSMVKSSWARDCVKNAIKPANYQCLRVLTFPIIGSQDTMPPVSPPTGLHY